MISTPLSARPGLSSPIIQAPMAGGLPAAELIKHLNDETAAAIREVAATLKE